MQVVIDIEANSLSSPDRITLIVCKDIKSGVYYKFREVTKDEIEKQKFIEFSRQVDLWIGHNILGYDFPVLSTLVSPYFKDVVRISCDTLILSKLIDYPRKGHSIEDYGLEFGIPKGDNQKQEFFTRWSQELEDYCVRDVDICHKIYQKYYRYYNNPEHKKSIQLEHEFQLVVNQLHDNGFAFNKEKAEKLLEKVTKELGELDAVIEKEFPPRLKLIREITPKVTKHGTLSKTDFRWVEDGDLSIYNGGPFCRCSWERFNPSSHKQLIDVLHSAGWSPTDKTQTHIDTDREISRLKRSFEERDKLALETLCAKLETYSKYGWKINEANLSTLPPKAPTSARSLAKRILLESRRRTLVEWLSLVTPDQRIHGRFYGIGAWTHRMAHQEPNTANIPNEFDTEGQVKLLGKEFRQLWRAPKGRLLVGVDAEGIQLRIFAHYINDKEFTDALVRGKKSDKTDPHSLNQRIIGDVCKSRAAAKRFIYALLLGAGIQKLSSILGCSDPETTEALDRLLTRYTGWATLKTQVFPKDARRGYFIGLDGRCVAIPGDGPGNKRHLAMSGYLQNGEAVIMKMATLKWLSKLNDKKIDFKLVNFVHDEWQVETVNNMDVAIEVAQTMADALREVGEELNLNCPLAGSYWNDDHHDYTIGTNWYQTH